MSKQRALIFGGGGQDGKLLYELLVQRGWEVFSSRSSSGGLRADSTTLTIDVTDAHAVFDSIESLEPSHVFNLAAVSSVGASWQAPYDTGLVNGMGALNVLEACWRLFEAGLPVHVIQASSSEVFGAASQAPQSESTPLNPSNPYAAAKAFAHTMVGSYRAKGLHASSAILFNHESLLRPEVFVTRKITRAATRIAVGLQDRVSLGSLQVRRDWGWAPEYVEAMAAMACSEVPADYVIATGVSHSVEEFVRLAFSLCGIDDWQSYVESSGQLHRHTDANESRGDARKIERELGWKAQALFEAVVARMVEHDMKLALEEKASRR